MGLAEATDAGPAVVGGVVVVSMEDKGAMDESVMLGSVKVGVVVGGVVVGSVGDEGIVAALTSAELVNVGDGGEPELTAAVLSED